MRYWILTGVFNFHLFYLYVRLSRFFWCSAVQINTGTACNAPLNLANLLVDSTKHLLCLFDFWLAGLKVKPAAPDELHLWYIIVSFTESPLVIFTVHFCEPVLHRDYCSNLLSPSVKLYFSSYCVSAQSFFCNGREYESLIKSFCGCVMMSSLSSWLAVIWLSQVVLISPWTYWHILTQ